MIATEYINESIPTLQKDSLAAKAIDWMEEFRVSQLPVINLEESQYLGMVDERLLYNLSIPEEVPIKDILLDYKNLYVSPNTHLYSILSSFGEHQTDIIPVVDNQRKYLGTIASKDFLKEIEKIFSAQERGAIIIISLDAIQYSMTELSRLIESNNAKILSSFVERDKQYIGKLQITFKLDITDVSFIIATLERFGYHIKNRFDYSEGVNQEQERLDLLLKYLEI